MVTAPATAALAGLKYPKYLQTQSAYYIWITLLRTNDTLTVSLNNWPLTDLCLSVRCSLLCALCYVHVSLVCSRKKFLEFFLHISRTFVQWLDIIMSNVCQLVTKLFIPMCQITSAVPSYCPVYGAFDLGLAVSVPLPIVTGIFVLLWFQSRLT